MQGPKHFCFYVIDWGLRATKVCVLWAQGTLMVSNCFGRFSLGNNLASPRELRCQESIKINTNSTRNGWPVRQRENAAYLTVVSYINRRIFLSLFLWQVKKNSNFATSKVKKKSNLTIDLLSLGISAPGPQVLTYRPQILRGVWIWTPFRVPGPERRVKRLRYFGIGRPFRSGVLEQN